ncbi:MAG: tRNA (adenine-N1)-methyltransferase [Anaerolineales bacterium]
MSWNLHSTHAQAGDLVELVGLRHSHFIFRLEQGGKLETHRGIVYHDDLIGKPWGMQVFSHLGNPFFLLQPSLGDLLLDTPRITQIMYPKDIGFVLVNLGIGPGQHVVEAGTGSGSLTCALAFAVGSGGRVTSYDTRPEIQKLAIANIDRLGLSDRVYFKLKDIGEGFDETNVDALFLDVQNPFDYMEQVRACIKPGGFFGSILPTVNQVIHLLTALKQNNFAFIEVCEVLLRYYRTDVNHFRPTDRMVAHTGFLVFARPVIFANEDTRSELLGDSSGIVLQSSDE